MGWLYGAVHYGTFERPSLSPAAVRAMARTRHVYLEQTDRAGSTWPMRHATAEDLEGTAHAKRNAAMASAERIRPALVAAKKLEKTTDGVAVVFSDDRSYHEHWALANNYCGAFYEYGTERLARAFASGTDITIRALETEASLKAALEYARGAECRRESGGQAASREAKIDESIERICEMILHDLALDQREGRPSGSLSAAATCVLDSRHRTMAAKIAEAVKAGEKPFVIVGRGHLADGQNLVALLAARGLALRRID